VILGLGRLSERIDFTPLKPQLILTTASFSEQFDPKQYGLAIHTASPELGLALSNFRGDRRHQTWALGRELSTHLQLHLAEFIQPQTWAELAFIAVAKGPGGFTGTRMGVVTARTLAQQLNIPLFALSTLAAVAWTEYCQNLLGEDLVASQISQIEAPDIAVQMPAQRGEVYAAIYAIDTETGVEDRHEPAVSKSEQLTKADASGLTALLPDSVMSQERWQQILSTWYRPHQLVEVEGGLGATAQSLLDLAYLDWQQGARPNWSEALPFYGQSPV
jgi:tRNA threonylcarbamoyl adenosine modification protein YeaZ